MIESDAGVERDKNVKDELGVGIIFDSWMHRDEVMDDSKSIHKC